MIMEMRTKRIRTTVITNNEDFNDKTEFDDGKLDDEATH